MDQMTCVYFTGLKTGYATGSRNLVLKTVNGGVNREATTTPDITYGWVNPTPGLPDIHTEAYPVYFSVYFP